MRHQIAGVENAEPKKQLPVVRGRQPQQHQSVRRRRRRR